MESFDLVFLPLGAAAFGGAERSLLDLAGRMRARGHRVLILAEEALRSTPFAALASERDVELRWVGWAPERGYISNLRAAIQTFLLLRARVIHFNISWRQRMWIIPLVARVLCRARLIGSMRAMPEPAENTPRRRYLFGLVPGLQL